MADGVEVLLLEGGDRVGGNIRTDRDDGWIIECGPNGYLDNVSTTPALVKRLKLERRVQPADERAAKRFLYRNGRLNLLATNPIAFLASPVLSLRGRLRILFEPFSGSVKRRNRLRVRQATHRARGGYRPDRRHGVGRVCRQYP